MYRYMSTSSKELIGAVDGAQGLRAGPGQPGVHETHSRRAITQKRRRRLRLVCAQREAVQRTRHVVRVARWVEGTASNVRSNVEGVGAGVGHSQLRVLLKLEADDVDAVRASRERSGGAYSCVSIMR